MDGNVGWVRELDRVAMWAIITAFSIVIAWYTGLIGYSTEFYVLLGISVFIAKGRQRYLPIKSPWIRARMFISELCTTFLVLGLLWRALLWVIHLFR